MTAADEAEKAIEITPEMLAKSVTGANRFEAVRIGQKAIAANERTKAIRTTRAIVGIDSQLLRCQWERSDVLIEARRLTYAADQQLAEARTKGNTVRSGVSRQLYDKAFQKWADVIAESGDVANESFVRYAILDAVDRYRREILNSASLPDDFPLRAKLAEWEPPAR